MNGTMDETYPIKSKYVDDPDPDFKVGKSSYDLLADDPYPTVGSLEYYQRPDLAQDIDLSDNDYYKGLCTLLEDEHGNNILEYISLLHTELIGVNKNLRLVRKEMSRMANCAEIMVKKSS